MNPNADHIEMILHQKPKLFNHNTIGQAERHAYIGRHVNTQDGTNVIIEAVRFNGILYLQVGPAEMGIPGWN